MAKLVIVYRTSCTQARATSDACGIVGVSQNKSEESCQHSASLDFSRRQRTVACLVAMELLDGIGKDEAEERRFFFYCLSSSWSLTKFLSFSWSLFC